MTRTLPADRGPGNETRVMTAAESALADRPGPALAAAYQQTHAAILAVFGSLSDRQRMTVIPACPAWTVRELAAHMTGVAADAITARFPVVNPHGPWAERQPIIDAFTSGQVTSRQGMATDQVLAEWAGHVAVLATMLRGEQAFPAGSIPIIDWMVVCDIAAHNQDLRGALHMPGDRDSAGVALSLQRYVAGLSQRIAAAGLPALRLCTERSEHIAGHGPPSSALTATEWELFRALSSRRSPSQIRSLRWSGDAEAYLPLLPAYGLPRNDLIE
jgi:mycothiol maleylpyruvate isomerase-like protein